MTQPDTCCTLVPYFTVHDGHLDAFRAGFEAFIERTRREPKCLFYGFSVSGNEVHCREGYEDADGVLAHLDNVGDLLRKALEIAELSRLEVHGPASEVEKLGAALAHLNPKLFVLEAGFRR